MSVVVIGLNHHTAPLGLLECAMVDATSLPKALLDLTSRPHLSEAVVLSTCNRTEIYAVAERFHGGYQDVREFFAGLSTMAARDITEHLFVNYDDQATSQLFSVASGLDSAVLGESEILGQVADAWEAARHEGSAGPTLNLLFRHALEVGKRVRTETGIGRGITSAAQAAVAMAQQRLGGLQGSRVLVLGAGEMAEGMVVALAAGGTGEVVVANRTPANAAALAARVGGRAVPLEGLRAELERADVLLTSTGASSIMVEHGDLAGAMSARAHRPLLVVDIAVPRDVDPAAGRVDGVTLLDMDDLGRFVEVGLSGRQREAARARDIIAEELERYGGIATAREAAPLITSLRARAEGVRVAELARYGGRLDGLDDRQRAAVEAITLGIVRKLLHEPTVRLKDTAGSARGDRLASATRDLFDLS
ncbi:MAG: glutamyl-tRNA reductase [Acidimicrobiia bacterium]